MTDEQRCIAAEMLLFRTVDVFDAATGATHRRRVETALYREYCALRLAHEAARAAYTAAYKEAQKTAVGRRTWSHQAVTLRIPVDLAYARWRSADVETLEQAEALLAATAHAHAQREIA